VLRGLYISAVGSMLDLGRLLVSDEVVVELGGVFGLELGTAGNGSEIVWGRLLSCGSGC